MSGINPAGASGIQPDNNIQGQSAEKPEAEAKIDEVGKNILSQPPVKNEKAEPRSWKVLSEVRNRPRRFPVAAQPLKPSNTNEVVKKTFKENASKPRMVEDYEEIGSVRRQDVPERRETSYRSVKPENAVTPKVIADKLEDIAQQFGALEAEITEHADAELHEIGLNEAAPAPQSSGGLRGAGEKIKSFVRRAFSFMQSRMTSVKSRQPASEARTDKLTASREKTFRKELLNLLEFDLGIEIGVDKEITDNDLLDIVDKEGYQSVAKGLKQYYLYEQKLDEIVDFAQSPGPRVSDKMFTEQFFAKNNDKLGTLSNDLKNEINKLETEIGTLEQNTEGNAAIKGLKRLKDKFTDFKKNNVDKIKKGDSPEDLHATVNELKTIRRADDIIAFAGRLKKNEKIYLKEVEGNTKAGYSDVIEKKPHNTTRDGAKGYTVLVAVPRESTGTEGVGKSDEAQRFMNEFATALGEMHKNRHLLSSARKEKLAVALDKLDKNPWFDAIRRNEDLAADNLNDAFEQLREGLKKDA